MPNGDAPDFITAREWGNALTFLKEFREDIKGDVAKLSSQLTDTKTEITRRQDTANGKLIKHDEAILALNASVLDTRKQVAQIMAEGCAKEKEHEKVLGALAQVGVTSDTCEMNPAREPVTKWQQHRGKVGWGAVGAGGATGALILLPHVWNALHWVLHHLTVTP